MRTLVTFGGFNPHLDSAGRRRALRRPGRGDGSRDPHSPASKTTTALMPLRGCTTLKAPTLILAGENDKIIAARASGAHAPADSGSRLEVIRHGSHCPQMDLPDLVNLEDRAFLAEINYSQLRRRQHPLRPRKPPVNPCIHRIPDLPSSLLNAPMQICPWHFPSPT